MAKDKKEQLKEHTEAAKEAVMADNIKRAKSLSDEFYAYVKKKGFKRSDQDMYKRYLSLIAKLKWIALPILDRDEKLSLYESNFQEALSIPFFSIQEKTRQMMRFIIDIEDRDELKKDIKDILDRNKALLTESGPDEGKSGTVENWIKDYVSEVGLKKAESIKFENYFVSGGNKTSLSQKEKKKLKDFFSFYEYLKTSSLSPEGLEDTPAIDINGDVGILDHGSVKKVKPDKEQKKIAEIVNKALSENNKETGDGSDEKREMRSRKTEEDKEDKEDKEGGDKKKPETENDKEERESVKKDKKKDKYADMDEKTKAKLLDLEKMLSSYPEGSLERKVVEEEMKKLEAGSRKPEAE